MEVNGRLPYDLMVEILARLPVKSLVRFKCVAKSWNALIKTQSFVNKHLIQNNRSGIANLVVTGSGRGDINTSTFSIFEDKTLTDLAHRDLELKVNFLNYFTCNGIFCLCNSDCRVALWNPSTREFKALPLWLPNFPPDVKLFLQSVGIGFDPKTNDLKVVHYASFLEERRGHCCDYLATYSLRSNAWKMFDAIPRDLSWHCFNMVHINGIMYWGLRAYPVSGKTISLDMSNEMFDEIYSPDFATPNQYGYEGLYEYDNTIAWLVREKHDERFHVLVFRETSWTKQVTMGPFYGLEFPLGFWINGEFLKEVVAEMDSPGKYRHCGYKLVLYDPKTQKIRILGTWGVPLLLQIFTYKESLVSLNGNFYDQTHGSLLNIVAAQEFFE